MYKEIEELREELRVLEKRVRLLMASTEIGTAIYEAYPGQFGEMKAQIMLAVRHTEDARMRLGKVLQYSGTGTSVFDKV